MKATVVWADEDRIKTIYSKSDMLSKFVGLPYHVDHIVPLVNNRVCGLHCEDNLQILTATDNLEKNNNFQDVDL